MDVPGTSHEWGSVADARKRTGLSKSQVHRLIRSGVIESEPVSRPQGMTYRVCLRHLPERTASEKQPSPEPPTRDVPETSQTRYLDIIQEQSAALIDLHEQLSGALTEVAKLREERGTYRERAEQIEARAIRAETDLEDLRTDLARPFWKRWLGVQ